MNPRKNDQVELERYFLKVQKNFQEKEFFPAIRDFILFIQSVPLFRERLLAEQYEWERAEATLTRSKERLLKAVHGSEEEILKRRRSRKSKVEKFKTLKTREFEFPKLKEKVLSAQKKFHEIDQKSNYASIKRLTDILEYYQTDSSRVPIGKIHSFIATEGAIQKKIIDLKERREYFRCVDRVFIILSLPDSIESTSENNTTENFFPLTKERDGITFFSLHKYGKSYEVGKSATQPARLLRCLTLKNGGVARRRIDDVFEETKSVRLKKKERTSLSEYIKDEEKIKKLRNILKETNRQLKLNRGLSLQYDADRKVVWLIR